nr:hypothetical protein [uncultured Sulfurimonas sp.]
MKIVLTQTDTTVGFLSQDATKLQEIKKRELTKPFIKVYKNFKTLLACGHRIPNNYKNTLRRSNKTTFIVKNRAFRVANTSLNSQLLRDLTWSYSTSANESSKNFNRVFCIEKADIIIEDKEGLKENASSSLFILNHKKRKKIR